MNSNKQQTKSIIRSQPIYIIAGLLLIGVLAVAFVLWKTGIQDNFEKGTALIITGSAGGMCPNGPCGGDNATIYNDGKYNNHKTISTEDMNRLRALVNSFDESTYSVNGDCGNSIADGSDSYLKFPQKYGDKEFEPCGVTYSANNPQSNPLKEILQIINTY